MAEILPSMKTHRVSVSASACVCMINLGLAETSVVISKILSQYLRRLLQ